MVIVYSKSKTIHTISCYKQIETLVQKEGSEEQIEKEGRGRGEEIKWERMAVMYDNFMNIYI